MSGARVYLGSLPTEVTSRDVEDAFGRYGHLSNVWVAKNPPGFAFLDYEDPRDAEDAVRAMDGRDFLGAKIRVEMAKGGTKRESGIRDRRDDNRDYNSNNRNGRDYRDRQDSRDYAKDNDKSYDNKDFYRDRNRDYGRDNDQRNTNDRYMNDRHDSNKRSDERYATSYRRDRSREHTNTGPSDFKGRMPSDRAPAGRPLRGENRVRVLGLAPRSDWRELKDHLRTAGEITFCKIENNIGLANFETRNDLNNAVRKFHNTIFNGSKLRIVPMDENDPGDAIYPAGESNAPTTYDRRSASKKRSRSRSRTRTRSRSRSRSPPRRKRSNSRARSRS